MIPIEVGQSDKQWDDQELRHYPMEEPSEGFCRLAGEDGAIGIKDRGRANIGVQDTPQNRGVKGLLNAVTARQTQIQSIDFYAS
jgi:hypothetical protein